MKTIIIVCESIVVKNIIEKTLLGLYDLIFFSEFNSALDCIYNSLPDLILVHADSTDSAIKEVLITLKEDPMFSQIPVQCIFPDSVLRPEWDAMPVEDYLWESDLERDLYDRIELCLYRSERIVEINPLTRLPGNISINKQIEKRLKKKEVFALSYADLDNFKPFNDVYGFSRGDEVIKIAGRLILNIVKNRQLCNSFVGHIGGDDFVYIMKPESVEETSQEIINAFDRIIPVFYDMSDRERGYIESVNRQGNVNVFNIVSLSIGITFTTNGVFSHYGELTERASEMKKYAKQFEGSCYKTDRRVSS